eukprot:g15698.t2
MGARQSRQAENANPEGESWQSRVSVKPSEKLVLQLRQQQQQTQQQQQQMQDVGSASADTLEDREERDQFRDRGEDARRARTRIEEDEKRARELEARKEAESAHLSDVIGSAVIPDLATGRRKAICEKESQAVVIPRASGGTDENNTIGKARSTHANGNHEPEISAGTPFDKDEPSGSEEGQETNENDDDSNGRVPPPFIIETSAVMQTVEEMAKSDHMKPSRLKTLQAKMRETAGAGTGAGAGAGGVAASKGTGEASLGQQANAEA